jgi:hypothetical protein
MKVKEVPQDNVKRAYTRGETRDVHYAVDDNGNIVKILSQGWDVMETSLESLEIMYNDFAEEARERIKKGESSPIEYFMYKFMIDEELLGAQFGFSARKVRKHFKPKVFSRLDDRTINQYADFFQIDIDQLKNFK